MITSEAQVQDGSSESHLQEKSHFKGILCTHVVAELDTAEHARRDNRRHGESLFTVITCVARG